MPAATVHVRMDTILKEQVEEKLKSMGLTLSAAINLLARQIVNQNRLPFEIVCAKPNAATLQAMAEAEAILEHPEAYKSYSSAREMFEDIGA